MATYTENVYDWLKRKGLGAKYEHAGIYCIKIDNQIVYIGKSANMLRRIAQHYVGIQTGAEKKYRIMAEARRKGHNISFDVLYCAQRRGRANQLLEIGEKEGEYIRRYKPILNTQIPTTEDWSKWDINDIDAKKVLQTILSNKGENEK